MKFFLNTEFIEGTQKTLFGKTKPTIDLISIGLVCEDGREFYAISKDFNLKEAWNRWQTKKCCNIPQMCGCYIQKECAGFKKEYWIRDNVLLPIFYELAKRDFHDTHFKDDWYYQGHPITYVGFASDKEWSSNYEWFKKLLQKYGKSNETIAYEICQFIDARWVDEKNKSKGYIYPGGTSIKEVKTTDIQFYAYYSSYDWVGFCWLFGNMINLPKGFPMYCRDLKQMLDEKIEQKSAPLMGCLPSANFEEKLKKVEGFPDYPRQFDEHNALSDAKWNKRLYDFLKTI